MNTTYWPTGAVKRTWGSRTYPVEYTYDPQGRVKTLTTWQDFAGDSGQAVTTWNYNSQRGWLDNKRYDDDTGPSYTYTTAGRLHTRTWERGVVTTYGYNAAGDLNSIAYDDGTPSVSIPDYDRSGRPKTVTDGSGTRTLSYHASGQLEDETYTAGALNGSVIDRSFDGYHRFGGVDAKSGAVTLSSSTWAYDEASRPHTITSGLNTATYTYHPNSPLVETVMLKNSGTARLTTANVHDHLDRLESVTNTPAASSAFSHTYTYNNANQRVRATRENAAYWSYGYDGLGQVNAGQKFLGTDVAVPGHDFGWTYDDIGNRLTARANGHNADYTPDALNQYQERTVPGVLEVLGAANADATVTLTFPASSGSPADILPVTRQGALFYSQLAVDNATAAQMPPVKITGVKNNVGSGGEDAVTEVTRSPFVPGTPEEFTHDEDGNLADDARWHYTWDGENRLSAMETSTAAAAAGVTKQKLEFGYDGQGRRYSKKVYSWTGTAWLLASSTRFLHDGWNMIDELDAHSSNAVVRTHVWGADLSGSPQGAGGVGGLLFTGTGTSVHAVAYDGNGNVTGLVDMATGNRSAIYEYNAFGETLIADGPMQQAFPFRFSTKFTDTETSLLYYGFRFYNPSTGRWLSRDPYTEEGGVNLYGFVDNAPTEWIDPLGLALYAFDGTNNDGYRDYPKGNETNVFALFRIYNGNSAYLPGVGTNDGLLYPFGSAFGAGGQARESRMLAQAGEFIKSGDAVADIIGFSRGAAQARDFANRLKEKYPCVKIRWIGLFDTVASEGLPNDVNIGYQLGIPQDTGSVLHLTAGGERRRKTFALTSINPGPGQPNSNSNYREESMPDAVHSDVGGFYGNNRGLANQALQRMWRDGLNNGVPFGPLSVRYTNVTPNGPNDSRWFNDKIVEAVTGKNRVRKVYYHP